jgi:heat-inducible transcriptional repressor
MLSERQEKLLEILIREYIKEAEAISSALLSQKYGQEISSATVRNELMALEEMGFIYQPHTSAGRIPTDAGYQYFLQKFFKNKNLNAKQKEALDELKNQTWSDLSVRRREEAKTLADLSGETVMVAFEQFDLFYTGISNLFAKPEFQNNYELVKNLSNLIDHLDEVLSKIFYEMDEEIKIFMGQNNPFHPECAAIVSVFYENDKRCVLVILGPKRMDYEKNIALLSALKNKS